ncbi:PaaI family thioesterase [Xylophilus sp. GW821-FHT01B05]
MTEPHDARKDYPDFGALLGVEIRLPASGVAELELPLAQFHCNRLGTVHGGVIMTLLDTAGMWACTDGGKAPVCPTVSLSCSFLRAVRIADTRTLKARGEVGRKGRSMYFATVSVLAGDALVATAQGVYAAPASERT